MEPLLGKTLAELQAIAVEAGLPRFVGKQLCEWIYRHRVTSFEQMTNISLKARQALQEKYVIGRIQPTAKAVSVDGTCKYLFPVSVEVPSTKDYQIANYQLIECVYLPEDDRTTLCISTQAGCKMGCRFCMTGTLGFHGNLTAAAILAQVLHFPDLTNLVLMGEGEPMDNIDNVLRALEVLTSDWGLGWSPKRITVSTVGILQKSGSIALRRFLDETDCHLAISLHNANPTERAAIMPAERLTPIEDVLDLVRQYDWSHQRRLSFEYICWSGVNDDTAHAKQLLRMLNGLPSRVNLIRFHQTTDAQRAKTATLKEQKSEFPASDETRMIVFRDYLSAHGVTCTIRKSRGEDILAACGMLVNALSENV
ncbi:MAG: 23S rRNA (adenine(2503)-C(2))-methyltransferase RlmN [Paludibacteraceae bacterium]|nr:23S rRNA (adenine(2503)-C(2))-methyltransferase RlmN [Paludibacteraceae bacterium]